MKKTTKMNYNRKLPRISAGVLCFSLVMTAIAGETGGHAGTDVFARVDDTIISVKTFREELINNSRNMFYHGTPPAEQIAAFERDMADRLITDALLLQEAGRRNLSIDRTVFEKRFERELRRFSRRSGNPVQENSTAWNKLHEKIRDSLLIEKLEQEIKQGTPAATEADLLEYYRRHPEKFTEPRRYRLSSILLGVDPASPSATWRARRAEAKDLIEQVRSGGDFAELARLHSADASAANGGDMGYLHEGMLSEEVQEQIDTLEIGEIAAPLTVLEGILIVRLDDRSSGGLLGFEQVSERVHELWLMDARESRWRNFKEELKAAANIEIDEQYFSKVN